MKIKPKKNREKERGIYSKRRRTTGRIGKMAGEGCSEDNNEKINYNQAFHKIF